MAFSVAENSCRTSAFHPEADIRLIFPKRSANDPKGTMFVVYPRPYLQSLLLFSQRSISQLHRVAAAERNMTRRTS